MDLSLTISRFTRAVHDAAVQCPHAIAQNQPVQQMLAALQRPSSPRPRASALPHALAACRYLDIALDRARTGPAPIADLADAFGALAPHLNWYQRAAASSVSASFFNGHANSHLIGPSGLAEQAGLVVGVSLLAPTVRYPMHSHPPAEIYLVMSPGEWFREDEGWYSPEIGRVIYHPAGITHAMRAGTAPLLAIWCLWQGAPGLLAPVPI